MNNLSKKTKITIASLFALALVVAGTGVIHAASTNPQSPMHNLVNAIATKFNLNVSDVQQVFDDQHAQTNAAHQQATADRLAQAVKDGKLTQAQADLIVAKQTELATFYASLKDKTPAERQATLKDQMTALDKWLTDNKIPKQYLMFGYGFKPMGMMGRMHGHMGMDGNSKSPMTNHQSPMTNNQ